MLPIPMPPNSCCHPPSASKHRQITTAVTIPLKHAASPLPSSIRFLFCYQSRCSHHQTFVADACEIASCHSPPKSTIEGLFLRGLKFCPIASCSIWQRSRFSTPNPVLLAALQIISCGTMPSLRQGGRP
ncbi:hypothetical protein AAHE18_15G275400 [Arachis hypogaea]